MHAVEHADGLLVDLTPGLMLFGIAALTHLPLGDPCDVRQITGHRVVDHARHLHAMHQVLRAFIP